LRSAEGIRLKEFSVKGDALERLNAVVDFELFRADLERAVPRSNRSEGAQPIESQNG
jgi:IS5 family transposase